MQRKLHLAEAAEVKRRRAPVVAAFHAREDLEQDDMRVVEVHVATTEWGQTPLRAG